MKKTVKILRSILFMQLAILLLVVVLGESEMIDMTVFNGGEDMEFLLLTTMELLTLCIIPLALRLFKFAVVRQQLRDGREKALLKWGILRLDMLSLPMIINAVSYYAFMSVAFAYLSVILFLCLAFVFPTAKRCQAEIEA